MLLFCAIYLYLIYTLKSSTYIKILKLFIAIILCILFSARVYRHIVLTFFAFLLPVKRNKSFDEAKYFNCMDSKIYLMYTCCHNTA